jgi:hypothetical protein
MAFRTVCSASGLRSQSDTALSKTPLFVKILTKIRKYAASEMGSFPSTANFRQLVPLAKTVSIGVSGFQGVAIRAKFFSISLAVMRPYDSIRWVSGCSGAACAIPLLHHQSH